MRAQRRHNDRSALPETRSSKKKTIRVTKPYSFFVAILFVLIIGTWIITWQSVAKFDSKSAKTIMKNVQAEYTEKSGQEITYKRIASQVEGGITYRLFADGEDYATVNLNPLNEKGFLNMGMYTLGDIKSAKRLVFIAQEGADLTVDGKPLSSLSPSGAAVLLPGLERLAAHPTNKTVAVPSYNTYVLEGFFEQPELKLGGKEPLFYGEQSLIASDVDDATKQEIISFSTDFSKRYSLFTIDVNGFAAIKNNILYTSPIYNNLRTGEYHWYPKVSSYEFTEFTPSEFVKYTDKLYSVRMTYSMHVVAYQYTSDYPTDLTYYLYKDAGKWQVIEMKVN